MFNDAYTYTFESTDLPTVVADIYQELFLDLAMIKSAFFPCQSVNWIRETHSNTNAAAQQIFIHPVRCFPFSSCCMGRGPNYANEASSYTNSLCEVNMSGQVWVKMPTIVSPLHNSSWMGFESIRGTQSSACWGHNGLIKAPYFTREKKLLQSINQRDLLHPGRCLLSVTLMLL